MSEVRDGSSAGSFVAVVGPSGAGKDSILREASLRLAHDRSIAFARRFVTRPADATEDLTSVTPDQFLDLRTKRAFVLTWEAHGLSYGLSSALKEQVNSGKFVIANVSRSIIQEARRQFEDVFVILIDAPAEIRAARIAGRGREREVQVRERLGRKVSNFDPSEADFRIDNAGLLEDAVEQFVAVIGKLRAVRR